jgi:hypothetical protein
LADASKSSLINYSFNLSQLNIGPAYIGGFYSFNIPREMENACDEIILSLSGLLFAISVTILGLISHSLAYTYGSEATNTEAELQKTDDLLNGTKEMQNLFALLPARLDAGSYWIVFAAGMGGVLDAVLIISFMFRRKPIAMKFPGGKAGYHPSWNAKFGP